MTHMVACECIPGCTRTLKPGACAAAKVGIVNYPATSIKNCHNSRVFFLQLKYTQVHIFLGLTCCAKQFTLSLSHT